MVDEEVAGRRQVPRRGEPAPKLYTEEEFHRALADVRNRDQQQTTVAELRKTQAELQKRIETMSVEVQHSIEALKEELLRAQTELAATAARNKLLIEERTEQFRIADLGEFEMGKFPDLLRFFTRNEPILSVIVARAMAESVVRQQSKEETEQRHYRVVTWASVAAILTTLVGFAGWLLGHLK